MTTDEQTKRNNRKTLILLIALLLLAACLLILGIWQGTKKPAMSKTQESPELGQATGVLANGQSLMLCSENRDICIEVSGCPTQLSGKVIMTPMGAYVDDQQNSEDIWSWPRTVDISFYDESKSTYDHDSEFCSIQVCFVLTDEQWKQYQAVPDNFDLQYLLTENAAQPAWISLLEFNKPEPHELCADYNRLGLYALAVKNLPAPVTGDLYAPVQANATPTQPGLYVP